VKTCDQVSSTFRWNVPYHYYHLITCATTVAVREFGWSLGLKFMRVIRDGTLRSSSLTARRPRRCNFEGNLTWATGASVSYGQMFTVKIVIVLSKASGSCSHKYIFPPPSLSLSLFFLSLVKMFHIHGLLLILLFAGFFLLYRNLFIWKIFFTHSLVII